MNDLMKISLAAISGFLFLWLLTSFWGMTRPKEFEVTEDEIFWLLRQGIAVRYNQRSGRFFLYWFAEEKEPKTIGMIKQYRVRVLN